LIQVDGYEHWWFEDRGPQCTLLVFLDDATRRLMHLSFVASEAPSPISKPRGPIAWAMVTDRPHAGVLAAATQKMPERFPPHLVPEFDMQKLANDVIADSRSDAFAKFVGRI